MRNNCIFNKKKNYPKILNFENALHSLSHRDPYDYFINKIILGEGILILGYRRLSMYNNFINR